MDDNQKIVMDTKPMPRSRYKLLVDTFATSIHVPHAIRLALCSVDMASLCEALAKVKWVVGVYSQWD